MASATWIVCFDANNATVMAIDREIATIILDGKRYELHEPIDNSGIHGMPTVQFMSCPGGVSGNAQRNKALESIKDPNRWVYCLDDDNLLHPNFIKLNWLLAQEPARSMAILTFDQELPGGVIRKGDTPRVCAIDQAQFMIRREYHRDYIQQYEADGILIEATVKMHKEKWMYINETLAYYNRIRP